MNVKYLYSLILVIALFLIAYAGVEVAGLQIVFGIIVPYVAVAIFLWGFVSKILGWANSAVPFRIPTTAGQQKSFDWIRQNKIDNPSTTGGVVVRMALEILVFRSLFRNTKMALHKGAKLIYSWEIWLWVGALAFHWAFFTTITRHLRFFTDPVPFPITILEKMDSFFQVGLPLVFQSGIVLLAALLFLFLRRLFEPQVRYISLAADYFPLFLLIGIALSGILMRYFIKTDIVAAKELAMGLVTFKPCIPETVGSIFYIHLFLVSTLLAYFPYSKLMHSGGVFLSPTRNLANNTRMQRHINPWNYPVKTHTYEEYEDDFREKMIEAGLPVDKE